MLKLTIAILAVALAGTASAAGWRSLRVDGSSEASFTESVAAFRKKLSPSRQYAFTLALQDIWQQGQKDAEAAQRDYAVEDYYRQVHGLNYDEVVTLLDRSGETARLRRAGFYARVDSRPNQRPLNSFNTTSPWPIPPPPQGRTGEIERGRTGMAGF